MVVEPVDGGLRVTGEIDASTAPDLATLLDPFPGHDVVIELSAVDFIDSSGLRVLIDAHLRAEQAGHQLILSRPSRAVSRLLEVSGAGSVLSIGE